MGVIPEIPVHIFLDFSNSQILKLNIMAKQLFFDIEARNKMKKGVDILANAVKVTLGPKGRNVVIEKKFGAPSDYKRWCYRCKRN